MAKFINMTCFSGSVGGFVGCMGPFGFYVRSKPRKSAKAPTQKQLENRIKMGLIGNFLRPFKEMIYLGFASSHHVKSKTAAMNMAVAHAMRNAIGGAFPELYIRPDQVMLSKGNVQKLNKVAVRLEDQHLYVQWSTSVNNFNAFADDCVYLLCYNVQQKTLTVSDKMRREGTINLNLKAEPHQSRLLVYACVSSRAGKFFSNSQYLGEF